MTDKRFFGYFEVLCEGRAIAKYRKVYWLLALYCSHLPYKNAEDKKMDETLLDEQIRMWRIVTSSFSVNKIRLWPREDRAFRKSINNSEVKIHEAATQLFKNWEQSVF